MRKVSRKSRPRRRAPSQAEQQPVSRTQGIMRMHQTMGNQAVMRAVNYVRLNDPASSQQLPPVRGIASGVQRTLIQREEHDLEPRVDIENVGTAGEMKVEPRKVEIQEKDQKTGDPFGSTASHVTIEYAVDESGQVSVGSLRPNYTITIYTPYITSDEFIEKFTPLMQKLWEKYDGDIAAFSEDTEVRNFHYYDQTLRHEMQHVGARQLALYDALKQYKHYLKDSGGLTKGEDVFKEKTDYYWRVAWNEGAEKVIPHERIHYLDALQMVREYQQRGPDVESPGWMQWIKDKLK